MSEVDFETRLHSIAKQMDYPRTPNIAGFISSHQHPGRNPLFILKPMGWSLTIVLVLLSSLLLIPPVRAAIIEFIQIGIVRIFPRSVESTLDSPPPVSPSNPSSELIPVLNQIAGETTLFEAQGLVDYLILLPSYPPGLGDPDKVFVQDADGAMTVLVWIDPQQPAKILLSLHFIPTGSWAISKGMPANMLETSVNGQHAIWGEGPYPLRLYNGDIEFTRLIDGHVLIWADEKITYRLETDLAFLEAVQVAESLKPVSP